MCLRVKNGGNFVSRSKNKTAKGRTLWPLNQNVRLLLGFTGRTGFAGGLAILATFHTAGCLLLCFALAAAHAAADEGRPADKRGAQDQGFDEFHLDVIGNISHDSSRPSHPTLTRCRIYARV